MEKNKNRGLLFFAEKIEPFLRSDSYILLDYILTDDVESPKYSADLMQQRLQLFAEFDNLYYGKEIHDEYDFMLQNDYSTEDVELFRIMLQEQAKKHDFHGVKTLLANWWPVGTTDENSDMYQNVQKLILSRAFCPISARCFGKEIYDAFSTAFGREVFTKSLEECIAIAQRIHISLSSTIEEE